MEEVSAAPLCEKWCNSTPSCTEPPDAWLCSTHVVRIHEYQDSTSEVTTTGRSRAYFPTKKQQTTGGARASSELGDKSSQASTIGVSGISEDSEVGTLPSRGEAAVAGSDSDHQKTEISIVSEAVPDAPKNEEQEETAQVENPTLLACAALRSRERQSPSSFSPWNSNRHQAGRNQKNLTNPLKWSILYQVERETTNNLEGDRPPLQKAPATAPSGRPIGSPLSEEHIPRYSRLFLLRVFLSSGTLAREKTTQRLQPPPGSHIRLDGLKEVLRDTKQGGRGMVSEFKKTLRRRSRPQCAKNEAFLPDMCLTEARQKQRGTVTPCSITNYISCLRHVTRRDSPVDQCYEIALNRQNNSGKQYSAVPLTLDACLDSRRWVPGLYGGIWTKSCTQTGTAREGPSPPCLVTRKKDSLFCPEHAEQSKSRGYNGKWKCPLMPSGANPRAR